MHHDPGGGPYQALSGVIMNEIFHIRSTENSMSKQDEEFLELLTAGNELLLDFFRHHHPFVELIKFKVYGERAFISWTYFNRNVIWRESGTQDDLVRSGRSGELR